jgi:hypothetical protein
MEFYKIANLCKTCKLCFGECKSDPVFADVLREKIVVDERDMDAVIACNLYTEKK